MFVEKIEPNLAVPISEGTIFTVNGPSAVAQQVTLWNLDDVNTLSYKYQWSDDGGSTWTDVAVLATLAPGLQVVTSLSGHIQFRLRAFGNLACAARVTSLIPFAGIFTYSA